MAKIDDEPQSITFPSQAALDEENRQAALRAAYEERQSALAKQTELIKEQHGARLEKIISLADVEDADIKALAVNQMARTIAERGVQPSQISGEDFKRLGEQSIEQAYKIREAQQREQNPTPSVDSQHQPDSMQGLQPHAPNYGKLQDTHEQVAGEKAATEQQNPPDRVQAFLAAERQQRQQQAQAPTGQAERTEAAKLQPPAEQQADMPTSRKLDRVEEFLKAENLGREAKKALLQELGRAAGREVNEQEGKEIISDRGGGQSL